MKFIAFKDNRKEIYKVKDDIYAVFEGGLLLSCAVTLDEEGNEDGFMIFNMRDATVFKTYSVEEEEKLKEALITAQNLMKEKFMEMSKKPVQEERAPEGYYG